ncbi:P2X purinoceptor 1 isoform X1 [Xenopus tropicalis]|uniref:P2X purinoceptor n=1 Tax=Xenopus tropicalis TaxID=8364 RepID=A0A6I8RW96_XENTR|nr:P2X purinoceptor 1 isoform X1 [Xenopus tropicalis]
MGQKMKEKVSSFLFEYDTPRMVLVRDKKVGLTFRMIQLGVLAYIIGWVFVYEKGYQTVDGIISSVSVKIKGLAVTDLPSIGTEIWDAVDYVFPPQGDSSFVVMTNFITTADQKMGYCNELPDVAPCKTNDDCTITAFRQSQEETNDPSMGLSGVMTGNCTPYDNKTKTCQIYAWCPVENDFNVPKPPLLSQAENFTLFIKNSISFPRHGVTRQNLVESVTSNYLKKCVYHKENDPLCPVFRLGYIVEQSGRNFSELAYKGGTISIVIDWQCDLDWPVRYCKPTYEFHGLQDENKVSQGFNFRHARYYKEDGVSKRTLFKVFGIRFDILVNGQGGKFDIIPTMTTIGSGIGIFGVATVVCDLMLLHVLPKRNYYKEKKFKQAKTAQKDSQEKEEVYSQNGQQLNSSSSENVYDTQLNTYKSC